MLSGFDSDSHLFRSGAGMIGRSTSKTVRENVLESWAGKFAEAVCRNYGDDYFGVKKSQVKEIFANLYHFSISCLRRSAFPNFIHDANCGIENEMPEPYRQANQNFDECLQFTVGWHDLDQQELFICRSALYSSGDKEQCGGRSEILACVSQLL
jgi:hypothetical protein